MDFVVVKAVEIVEGTDVDVVMNDSSFILLCPWSNDPTDPSEIIIICTLL